jgi:murein DD-endopeptidase MepM/ murein hydrolase activator NlpD
LRNGQRSQELPAGQLRPARHCFGRARRATTTTAIALLPAFVSAAPARGPLPPPVSPTCITSPFGPRSLAHDPLHDTFHYGIDLRAAPGTPVRAVAPGVIIGIDRRGAGGLEVRVRHPGFTALYGHLGRLAPAFAEGKRSVVAGEELGVVGRSGLTFGPHLYFEMNVGGERVDPAPSIGAAPCSK